MTSEIKASLDDKVTEKKNIPMPLRKTQKGYLQVRKVQKQKK